MRERRVALDAGGHHAILLSDDGARLVHDAGDRRSLLHEALRRHLRVEIDGAAARFDAHDALSRSSGSELAIFLGPLALARIDLATDALVGEPYTLSPLECRFLADNGAPHPASADAARATTPATDLHSHFAACVKGADLLALARDAALALPRDALSALGVRIEQDVMSLADLPPHLDARIAERLAIPHDRQITFLDMEGFYRRRAPLTKHPALLIPQCRRIARDYAAAGVRYVELSLSDVARPEALRAIHRELPAIEEETGVTVRFLVGISRHDDLEWDLDLIERLVQLAPSRYVVGVDFLGHETNPTRAFGAVLSAIAARLSASRPGYVIRVHAGESPAFPGNVREALELVGDHDVTLRVGHGLFGVDDETLARLRDRRVIVEFNLTSNFSLNNIQSLADAPLARYVRAGVEVVLGSDGPGLYGTDARFEARAARLAGLTEDELEVVRATERDYVETRARLDAAHTSPTFEVPDALPHRHWGPEVGEKKRAAARARSDALHETLSGAGISLLAPEAIEGWLDGRRMLSVAGSWKHAWSRAGEASRDATRALLEELVAGLDPARVALVTGGTRHGVEHEVQQLAAARSISVLAALVADSPAGAISDDVDAACVIAPTFFEKAAALYGLVRDHAGVCLFVGGGPIVNDEIQVALNLRLRVLLVDGPAGASTRHAREQPERAVRTAAEILDAIADEERREVAFWHPGPNPAADLAIFRHSDGGDEVLLVRRDLDAPGEAGRWALPGGFVATDAARGEPWREGRESALEACVREAREETGLDLMAHAAELVFCRCYEGGGRDPRDGPIAWSRSIAFAGWLPEALREAPLAGGDDADDARWHRLDDLPELAFDHARIVADARARL